MGCFPFMSGRKPARPGAAAGAQAPGALHHHPSIVGPASCRRLSLDGPRPRMPSDNGGCAAAAAAAAGQAPGALTINAVAAGAEGPPAVNPLRRVSLPLPGAEARPDAVTRRTSLPWAAAAPARP